MENDLLLVDRVGILREFDKKFDLLHNAYVSFSGGKDSCVLSQLVDIAFPGNRIPRVFINTGVEYNLIVKFVRDLQKEDDRIVFVSPARSIKGVLREYGYPFKSKEHSTKLNLWQRGHRGTVSIRKYLSDGRFACPSCLRYQFGDSFKLKVSPYCCRYMKKIPARQWAKENGKCIVITGMRKAEGGQRVNLHCLSSSEGGNYLHLNPLAVVDDAFVDWFIARYAVSLCPLYYDPYNFKRTGCKGCPFSLDLQEQLTIMELYLPKERSQCEWLWYPVYQEYRRIGYRLSSNEQMRLL